MPAHTCKKSTGVRMKLQPCFYHLQVFASMMLPATMDVAQVCLAAWKSAACVRISFHNGLFRGYVSSKEGINNYILTYTFYRYIHPPEATPTSPGSTRADDESSGSRCHADDGLRRSPKKRTKRHWRLGNYLVSGPQTCFLMKIQTELFLDYF